MHVTFRALPNSAGCSAKAVTRSFNALGTVNTIYVPSCLDTSALDAAVTRVIDLDRTLSVFRAASEVSQVNMNAGIDYVQVSGVLLRLLKRAVFISEISGGSFDVTAAPLVALWGIGKKGTSVPEPYEIEAAKTLVGYRDIIIDEEKSRVMLRHRGQQINLGGIAKGYAADEVKSILLSFGIDNALINLGGNVAAVGAAPNGEPWTIGIQDPTKPTGAYIGTVEVSDKTLVTSGSNEQFFIHNGIRYHHIIDPRTGMPADTGLLSVTAIGGCSMDMDALTTAVFVLGMEKGRELLNTFDAQAVFVKTDGDVYVTEGLRNNFRLIKQKVE